MIRNPQHLVLQLSVAPTRRSISAAASSYHSSEKAPPAAVATATATATATASPTKAAVRAVRMSVEPAPSSPSSAMAQPRSRSEERPPSSPSSQAKAQVSTEGSRRVLSYFPLGYKEAAQQWWTSVSASAAERGVLSHVRHLCEAKTGSQPDLAPTPTKDPYGPRLWRSQMVTLSGKNRALNEYSIERAGEEATDTLVMLHGYGAGLGFFYRNFEPLSQAPGWRLFALDMLGMGNSSRPTFRLHAKDSDAKITEAEAWFVDALEEWRQARRIERFTLLGHSLGGYLAVAYALKYPGHLNKLILASPVGIPEDPYAVSPDLPEPQESTLVAEFAQDQQQTVAPPGGHVVKISPSSSATTPSPATTPSHNYRYNHNHLNKAAAASSKRPVRRPLPSWLVWLWDANVSPFTFVRASGPLGPRLVSGWTSRRFSHLPADEADALHTYSYSLFRQRGSGEYALPYLLAPGAYARRPVIKHIQDVGRQLIPPSVAAATGTVATRETGYPIVMLYGDHDWMDVAGGFAAEHKINSRIAQSRLDGSPDTGSAKVILVRNAGHHLYLDNPDDFNKYIRTELDDTKLSEEQRRKQQ